MSTSIALNSANNFLQLLYEDDYELKIIGLEKLISIVNTFWPEIADKLPDIESIFEDEKFSKKELAALLASKVYYHLEEYEDALYYALQSKDLFNPLIRDQYTDCLIGKCIDKYKQIAQNNYENKDKQEKQQEIEPRIKDIVELLLGKCIEEGNYKYAIGIALDIRKLIIVIFQWFLIGNLVDQIQQILEQLRAQHQEIIFYLFEVAQQFVASREFRMELLQMIIGQYEKVEELQASEYDILCQCYFKLNMSQSVGKLLFKLLSQSEVDPNQLNLFLQDKILLAYQIAQDISENENQNFTDNLIQELPVTSQEAHGQFHDKYQQELKPNLIKILTGQLSQELYLLFLKMNNQADPQILEEMKKKVESKNSVVHGSLLIASSFFQAGTTNDSFLRQYFEWVAKGTHWSKFSLIASMGVIHRGNHKSARELLNPYYSEQGKNFYAHGGSLYSMGLINYNTKDAGIQQFLVDKLKDPTLGQNEQVIHGACLGLGLVAFATADLVLYEQLKNILFTNSAITGEAAGIGIGLIMAGSGNETVIGELLQFASETEHEKIIRAISLALAMINIQREDAAETVIEQLCREKDEILRFGAVYTIAMAYIGTANAKALEKLLKFASSDHNDDVRRAAVIGLSFVLINHTDQLPKIAQLFSVSYNPHVRYGTALALGIANAGKQTPEAMAILEELIKDPVDFVKQGAQLGMAMMLMQTTEQMEPKVIKLKNDLKNIYEKKHEDSFNKMIAMTAYGILEAGGRNCLITLTSRTKSLKIGSCASMLIFAYHWYWFPLIYFLPLTFTPSALLGVDKTLKIPTDFQFKCNCKPSLFAYPANNLKDTSKEQQKGQSVTLSVTAKAKARAQMKGNQKDLEEKKQQDQDKMELEGKEKELQKEKEKEVPEPKFYTLTNPSRILERQEQYIQYIDNQFEVIVKNRKRGIIFLRNLKPQDPVHYYEIPAVVGSSNQPQQQPQQQAQVPAHDRPTNLNPPEEFIFDEEAQK